MHYKRSPYGRYKREKRNDTLTFVLFPNQIDSAAWIKEDQVLRIAQEETTKAGVRFYF